MANTIIVKAGVITGAECYHLNVLEASINVDGRPAHGQTRQDTVKNDCSSRCMHTEQLKHHVNAALTWNKAWINTIMRLFISA